MQNGRRLPILTRAATDGHWSIRGLPPGEYYLAALAGFDPQEWYTTPFLEQVTPTRFGFH
jgi:hypothetical protein